MFQDQTQRIKNVSQKREAVLTVLSQVFPPSNVWKWSERGEELLPEEGVPESQNRSTRLEILYPCGSDLILNLEKGRNRGRHSELVRQEA
jgi:hypothetical protein